MQLLLSASIISAFVAGVAALFAPCCITVLLPSYFASIFRERYKVFLMTFIFFLGVLMVFLPLGLGMAALGRFFSQYHNTIFGFGGAFLILIGFFMLSGRHLALPFHVKPALKRHNAFSVFTLGIFSGIATTCCAPVLAGVLALSALPGSLFWGSVYTLSYVLGMVAPLFLISVFWDKSSVTQKLSNSFRKTVGYSLLGQKVNITIAEIISGVTFLGMGLLTVYLAATNRLFVHSEYQIEINILLTEFLNLINGWIKNVPEYVWAGALILGVVLIAKSFFKQIKKEKYD